MYQPLLPMGYERPAFLPEPKGVVYTKPWVVELLLDLAGYDDQANLVDSLAVEPAAGAGAFLVPMALRLVASCLRQKRPLAECESSLIAYELNESSAETARNAVVAALKAVGIPKATAVELAAGWVRTGDYLFDAPRLRQADFVIGNPPYIRLEDIPIETASLYRGAYPTMRGRADVYVAFFEAALRQLKQGGVCAFICADRWMLNQYGADLRRLVTQGYSVETLVEMHNANAFDDDVSAYPAITVIRRGRQERAVVASAGPEAEQASGSGLALSLRATAGGKKAPVLSGLTTAVVESWFTGSDPWPCSSPTRLALLRRLEDRFEPLESEATATKVGIGVATGLDKVFITKNANLVEESRLLPLAMALDTAKGHFQWSGHYLVNPWDADGLVNLKPFPRLRAYFDQHREQIERRNTAQRNPGGWYRTIDRVTLSLTEKPKLYIHDIKERFNPVLDEGKSYPHHNLYFITSERWNLEVLGGLLLSAVGQFFIESYGVRMRGGYLRFQAQYLRRIRVPSPDAIPRDQAKELVKAFRQRDGELATRLALEIYQVAPSEIVCP
jgi:adenine-specific DNA-methyltransferase